MSLQKSFFIEHKKREVKTWRQIYYANSQKMAGMTTLVSIYIGFRVQDIFKDDEEYYIDKGDSL